jgi:hypothetical protein
METAAATLVAAILEACPRVRDGLNGQITQSPQAGADFLQPYYMAVFGMIKKVEKLRPDLRSSK